MGSIQSTDGRVTITESARRVLKIHKKPRLPRKKKKALKKRWGALWIDFIKIKKY